MERKPRTAALISREKSSNLIVESRISTNKINSRVKDGGVKKTGIYVSHDHAVFFLVFDRRIYCFNVNDSRNYPHWNPEYQDGFEFLTFNERIIRPFEGCKHSLHNLLSVPVTNGVCTVMANGLKKHFKGVNGTNFETKMNMVACNSSFADYVYGLGLE